MNNQDYFDNLNEIIRSYFEKDVFKFNYFIE